MTDHTLLHDSTPGYHHQGVTKTRDNFVVIDDGTSVSKRVAVCFITQCVCWIMY